MGGGRALGVNSRCQIVKANVLMLAKLGLIPSYRAGKQEVYLFYQFLQLQLQKEQ